MDYMLLTLNFDYNKWDMDLIYKVKLHAVIMNFGILNETHSEAYPFP